MSKKGVTKLVVGGFLGAIAGILLAPKTGRETREKIKKLAREISKRIKTGTDEVRDRVADIFGEVNNEAILKYRQVKDAVVAKMAAVRTTGKEVDKSKYGAVVDEVVGRFKKDFEATKDGLEKIAKYLKKDWEKMRRALS